MELVNQGEYWESHEVLEGPWRRGRSRFYHGLILYASAFVHARRKNSHGLRSQLDKARSRLEEFRPAYLGLDVDAILAHAERCRRVAPPDAVAWPRLELRPELIRGDEPELMS